ncbi:hypothetical protein BGW80DRAFT_1447503 [Lactifluus volemus]|nr:hypothetical protein BGW80DRAFT_1447503 [Lactifluus volemus]
MQVVRTRRQSPAAECGQNRVRNVTQNCLRLPIFRGRRTTPCLAFHNRWPTNGTQTHMHQHMRAEVSLLHRSPCYVRSYTRLRARVVSGAFTDNEEREWEISGEEPDARHPNEKRDDASVRAELGGKRSADTSKRNLHFHMGDGLSESSNTGKKFRFVKNERAQSPRSLKGWICG